ncbi:hypothetical protein KFK09_014078 [Dendrobium nobile]|uniref:Uncharacterized protein n=1 Tax=Dendrobium nobile TaxID=94219 RepID=A0A8T3B8Z4_DENNO|nr:hypothetical protein KFK09_014078 [Dendrobium nobile]
MVELRPEEAREFQHQFLLDIGSGFTNSRSFSKHSTSCISSSTRRSSRCISIMTCSSTTTSRSSSNVKADQA